jgi:hypothetical protein
MRDLRGLVMGTLLTAVCAACGASPAGTPTTATATAAAATNAPPTGAAATAVTPSPTASPAGPLATTKVVGAFVLATVPNVRHSTGPIVCLLAADQSFARYEVPDLTGALEPWFILVVGTSSQTPDGLPAKGGGTFSGPSVFLDGKTVYPAVTTPTVTLSADLLHSVLTGNDGNATYTMTMDCNKA